MSTELELGVRNYILDTFTLKSLSRVRLFAIPWTIAHEAPPSVGFSSQEYWSGLPFPSPGALPNPGIKPGSPALQANAFSSVQSLSRVDSLRPHESQHARPPCPSPTPGVYSNSYPSSRWCHPAISSSVTPFSSSPQSLPASGSFPMSQLFAWGSQSTGVSASASVLPMNTQDWSPLGWTGWISLQSKGLSRVFSSTTAQKHQFFGAQLSSESNSHIHTWPLERAPSNLTLPQEKALSSLSINLFFLLFLNVEYRKISLHS